MAMGTGRSLHTSGRAGIAIVALIAFGTCLVFGQSGSATISGVARDTTGAVLPGVAITIKHVDSGLTRTVVTSEQGGFRVSAQ